jgi:hypothetical protein
VIAIARVTIGETARRRILWVLVALAVVAVALTGWGVGRLVELARAEGARDAQIRLAVSQVLIFIAFMFGFVLAMTAAFLGAPAIASDIESGVALALLARPLRRSSYLIGRWIGLAVVVVGYAALSGFLAIGVVAWVSGYTPPDPIAPVLYLAGQALVILTLTVVLSTRLPPIAGGAVAVVAYGLAWMAGVMASVGAAVGADGLRIVGDVGHVILPTDALWRGVVFGLEPPLVILIAAGAPIARGSPFFADSPPPPEVVAWAGVWVVLAIGLASLILRRREL